MSSRREVLNEELIRIWRSGETRVHTNRDGDAFDTEA